MLLGFKRFWKIHYGLIRNRARISLPGMMTGTDILNVSLTMNFYPSFSRMLDLSLSDLILLFVGKVFYLACWVDLDELPGSVETLATWGTSPFSLLIVVQFPALPVTLKTPENPSRACPIFLKKREPVF
jgi:hypothetical protein